MTEIIAYVVSAVVSAVGGCIVYFIRKHFKRLEKYAEDAETRRATKDLLVLKSLKAIGELCTANAIAIRDGKANGCMKRALKDFQNVDKELNDFLMQNTVDKVNKK